MDASRPIAVSASRRRTERWLARVLTDESSLLYPGENLDLTAGDPRRTWESGRDLAIDPALPAYSTGQFASPDFSPIEKRYLPVRNRYARSHPRRLLRRPLDAGRRVLRQRRSCADPDFRSLARRCPRSLLAEAVGAGRTGARRRWRGPGVLSLRRFGDCRRRRRRPRTSMVCGSIRQPTWRPSSRCSGG